MESPVSRKPARRLLTHVLLAAALFAAAAPAAWMAYDHFQAQARVRELAGDAKSRQAALGHLFAHAGTQPALVRALAEEVPALPADQGAEALRVAALSCAAAGRMNPRIAESAEGVLGRLNRFEDQLRLLAELENASLAARKASRSADTAGFDAALAQCAAARVLETSIAGDKPENALRIIGLFERLEPGHPAVKAGLDAYMKPLEKATDAVLLPRVALLNQQGKWGAGLVPAALYDRWLAALAAAAGDDTRALAVSLIRTRPHAGDHPELGEILLRLTRDPVPGVRLDALHAATEWVRPNGAALHPTFAAAIIAATRDADPTVAREAWIVAGLFEAELRSLGNLKQGTVDIPADLETMPSPVAEAAFGALVKIHPGNDALIARLAALLEKEDTLAVSAAAALASCDRPLARQAVAQLLAKPPGDGTVRQLCQWRALLAGTPEQAQLFLKQPNLPAPLADAAAFAAARAPDSFAAADAAARRHRLAALEGLPPASATFATPEEDFGLAFLALAKAEKDPEKTVRHLRPLLDSQESVWRDAACLLAATRLDKAQATELARDLLATPGDEAKMSGALLCGLAKVYPRRIQGGSAKFLQSHPEWTEAKLYALSNDELAKLGLSALDALNDNANRWNDAKTEKEKGVLFATQLGLALRGDRPMEVQALLFDKRIPYSTVLLALLRQDKPAALDMLLGDDARLPFVPRQLLSDWRFAEVVAPFLPENAPKITYWADIHLQKLQFERMRAWWRLEKNRLQEAAGAKTGK